MPNSPIDPLQRSRRSAIAIMVFGPLLVCTTLIGVFGNALQPKHANFAPGDQAGTVALNDGVTALALESD